MTLAGYSYSEGAASIAAPEVAIDAQNLSKWFSATHALDNVTFSINKGKIHALVGENGAGKSTLLGILSGRVVPSKGELSIFGQSMQYGNPRVSHHMGIATIYQELTLVPALSAEANVFLGQELGPGPFLSGRKSRMRFKQLCEDLDVEIDERALAGGLPVAQQQILEIMRGVAAHARIMLFDEPTAALPEHERESALNLIRRLSEQGVTIIFVSHHLNEVLAISDDTSVLRNGQLIETKPTSDWTERELIRTMLGHEVQAVEKSHRKISEEIVIRAEGITVPGAIQDISIEVHGGEIVGLAGLVGSGRTTLLRSLAGLEPTSNGKLWIDGHEMAWPRSPITALKYGIALVPEDRKRQGLVLGMSVADNITLTFLDAVSRFGVVLPKLQLKESLQLTNLFNIPASVISKPASSLSGGNQQRVLISKWLHRKPRILLADEPTRGIDVGAKKEVLDRLQYLAETGLAVVMASSELEEVISISNRIMVLADGMLVEDMKNGLGEITVGDLLKRAFRVSEE